MLITIMGLLIIFLAGACFGAILYHNRNGKYDYRFNDIPKYDHELNIPGIPLGSPIRLVKDGKPIPPSNVRIKGSFGL